MEHHQNGMHIIIAGASGFLGRMLVPILKRRGAHLLLLGRDRASLAAQFDGIETADYAQALEYLPSAELLLNLAVLNNDRPHDIRAMTRVNADFAAELAAYAQQAGVKRFVNVSSIHALDLGDKGPYAVSKRAGVVAVDAATGAQATHLYLPAVVGDAFAGALRPLNALPRSIAQAMLGPLGALKPILQVAALADWIMHDANFAPRNVILTTGQEGNSFYTCTSRLFDLCAAILGLVLLSPVFCITWFMIRTREGGSAIFAQERIGRFGRPFICYKFRTMALGTVQAATHEVSAGAVTVLGAHLRRLKIDELPQLWNVLKGEMGLIGPRPCLPSQHELIERRRAAGILNVRPGISGLAQVAGIDMSDPARLVEWDARYIALRSLALDLKLIMQTLNGGGRGDRVAV